MAIAPGFARRVRVHARSKRRRTSPAIDHGLTLTTVTTDIDGTPRPQGSAYDLGAYEWHP